MKPTLFMMVGFPGSGKSTQVERNLEQLAEGTFVYSTDAFIENYAEKTGATYDAVFSECIKEATRVMNDKLDDALRERRDIVWDQTNLSVKKRAKISRIARNHGYEVQCVSIHPANEEEIRTVGRRLMQRPGKVIPKTTLDSMAKSYVKPTMNEDFDGLDTYNIVGVLLDSTV